jgi:hypothetical protein
LRVAAAANQLRAALLTGELSRARRDDRSHSVPHLVLCGILATWAWVLCVVPTAGAADSRTVLVTLGPAFTDCACDGHRTQSPQSQRRASWRSAGRTCRRGDATPSPRRSMALPGASSSRRRRGVSSRHARKSRRT